MKPMSPQEEKQFIGDVERAIQLTHDGVSPTEAITKIASEGQYGPEHIKRMTQAFNKSKSVYKLKTASTEERAQPFSLANAEDVIKEVYVSEKQAEQELQLPTIDFSAQLTSLPQQKTASVEDYNNHRNLGVHRFSADDVLRKYHQVKQGVRDKLASRQAEARYMFGKYLDDVVDSVIRMSDNQMRKVAQKVVNSYPNTGEKLIKVLNDKMNRNFPEVQKTASAAVFQAKEPYLSIVKVYEYAEKIAKTRQDLELFDKQAESVVKGFLGNAAANLLTEDGGEKTPDRKEPIEDLLDPAAYNKLKEIETQRNFMNLVLYDDDLKNYDYKDLVGAYNTSVSTVPDAYKNPAILKNLMIGNLQGSGLKDKFELKQELELQKELKPDSPQS
jgi:hypothetical protein